MLRKELVKIRKIYMVQLLPSYTELILSPIGTSLAHQGLSSLLSVEK